MNVNLSYDSSIAGAPSGFTTALNYVVNYLDSTFTNNVTVNIGVGWGEVDGQLLSSGALGESITNYGPSYSYSQVHNALSANTAKSSTDVTALASLPTTDPTGGGSFDVSTAQEKALGLLSPNATAIDGWAGFDSTPNTFTFDANNRAVSGLYDFIGVVLHEITEVMGRTAGLDFFGYTIADLFRYSSSGVRQLVGGHTAYFSIDGGKTNLHNYNTNSGGDYGDWASSAGQDAALAFSPSGQQNNFTTTDVMAMDAIGWNTVGSRGTSGVVVSSITTSGSSVTSGNGDLNAGKIVTLTMTMSGPITVALGMPTLSLNDGGTATYTGGSGSSALTFSHTVLVGQNTGDLTVAGVNLNGATINDNSGNSADLSAATNYNPSGLLQIDTTAPVVAISSTGGLTNHAQQTVSGTVDVADAGSIVTLYDGTTVLGTATVQSNGSWSDSITLTGNGIHTLTAKDTDAAGNTGTSNAVVYTLNTVGPTISALAATTDTGSTHITAGHLVTITMMTSETVTVTGAPTLQLNDGEVAGYTNGSATNTLTFTYAVQPGDNVADLQVIGLNLPSGAAIQDQAGNALSVNVTGDFGIQIDTTTVPATSVQQEVLGLYAALYNRATDSGGVAYWAGVVGQQPDGSGVTAANAGTTAVTLNDAAVLGQLFVSTQSTYFNSVYGSLNDSAFINAMYVNIGGNAGDPGGVQYWANLLQAAEAAGQSVQAARAGLAGQFVHDLVDVNLATFTGLTSAQLLAATQRQAGVDNKIAVSLAISNASQQPGGSILVVHTVGDAAFVAETTILQGITYNPATVTAAILGINNAVAHQDLSLI